MNESLTAVGVIVGVLGIAVTLWVFYCRINRKLDQILDGEVFYCRIDKKLDQILDRETRCLTCKQAADVMDLYFDLTRLSLQDKIRFFLEHGLTDYIATGDDDCQTAAKIYPRERP